MASSENNNDLHGPGRGGRRDGRSDLGQEESRYGESDAESRTEIEVKRSSAASIWSPPHVFHRQSQHQQPLEHQHHHFRIHLNPLQYVHQELRPRNLSGSRKPLSISTTAPPSPANGVSSHSPISRSSSKASSPTTFYQNANHSTLYHPPHLHFTHQQPVKETHRLDRDFDPSTGKKSINKYEIIDEIGRGTHGKVKLGRHITSKEYVAIKIVERHSRPRLGKMVRQDDEKVRREIAILKKCRHPNVVRLIEVIDDPASKKVYLVLEYVELREIEWRKFGPLDVLRRERNRLKRELAGENGVGEEEDSEGERIRRWKRRRRKQLKEGRPSTGTSNLSSQTNDEKPNFWSLELGGLTEEDDEATDDDYPRVGEDERRGLSIVDAPHIPSLDSDTEEPSHHISSLSLVALGPNSETPAYSFSHDDLHYVPALTFERARSTFRDTVLGLEYLHYHGIIHRDIKPANLLWTKDYRVKISDFGVSYLGRGAAEEDEAGPKGKKDKFSGRDEIELAKTVGTPAFFAPELCYFDTSKPRPQITTAIDVWALGVTLYCLIFARCPFLADGEFELFNVIAKQKLFIPKRRLRPGQGYSASVKSPSRPTSSNRPLSFHHQRTHSGMLAKIAPIHHWPASGSRRKGVSEDLETEIIPDDLRDLLEKLLTKDPTERITVSEVKRHRWVLQGIANPMEWLENTDPERVNGGGRIEVNEEEMEKAVVPASWTTGMIKQVKSGINKLRQKMGMGSSASEGTTPKKEKVGLHPLASLGNDPRGPHSLLGANRPGSSSSNSTLHEKGEALNRFSLSLQTGTPYIVTKVVAPPPISASSLTRLLASSPAKSTTSTISNTTTKEMNSTSSPSRVHSPGTVKRLFDSQTSRANSLSRSLSRSSNHSDRTAMSGAESISPSTVKEKKDKILSSSFLRRTRSALTNRGSSVNDRNASEGAGGLGNKAVRRVTSSNLGHEFTNSPSPSFQSTIRRISSPSTQESPSNDQILKISLATVPSRESASLSQIQFVQPPEQKRSGGGGSVSGSATTRSRRSSTSSNSTSMIQARDTVAAALGGLFGKGRRLVRSFSRSRDTLASESEAVLSTSSGDDEGNHRIGLRISMLRRKRSSGVEATPVVSRVNALGTVRSCTSTTAASPIYENGDGYFDIEVLTPADVMPPLRSAATTSTITTSRATTTAYTTTTAATSTSASSTALHDFDSRDLAIEGERMQWSKKLNLHDTSCPPSPNDSIMWERQAKARERREAARKEQDEEMARKLAESLQRIGNDIDTDNSAVPPIPSQHLWQPGRQPAVSPSTSSCNHQPAEPQHHFAPDVHSRLVTSSSEERLYPKRGHRHTDTATSSLTESTSLPSIQSMMDSSAASSVSFDAGWPAAAKKITRPVAVPTSVNRDSGIYSLKNGNGSIAVLVEDDITTAAPQQQRSSIASTTPHLAPPQATLSTLNSGYHSYIHSKSDEDDDGDDEALFLDLCTSNRRKSQGLSESPRRPKNIAIGVLQHQHHKRAVSATSARSKASDMDREKGTSMDGTNERVRRRRSRSNTAGSAIGGGGTGSASEGRRDRDKRSERKEARDKEKAQRERERATLPALLVPVTQ